MSTDQTFLTNEPGKRLVDRFRTLINDTRLFDCLVGYFFASGFHQLYNSLEKTEKIRDTESRADKWIELTEKVFDYATYARVRFEKGTPDEKKEIVMTLGSNPLIEDGKFRLSSYEWFEPIKKQYPALEAVDALSKSGQFLSELDGISVGQGLNVSKSSIYEKSLLKKFPFVKKATVPIATSADKPKFEITSVECFLVDSTRLSEEEREKLKKAEINLYTSSSTSKDYPTMSLPRGLSDKHYCTVHEIKTHTASAVDLYSEKDFGKDLRLLNIWAVLNSTLGWLIRETSGRKNLGGGMLKAEAVDLKAFPLYLDLKKDKQISKIFTKTKGRLVKSVFEEMKTEEHKAIDRIVFDHLSILPKNRKGLIDLTLETVRDRYAKSKT